MKTHFMAPLLGNIMNSAPRFVTANGIFSRKPTREPKGCVADFGDGSFHARHPYATLRATLKRRTSIL